MQPTRVHNTQAGAEYAGMAASAEHTEDEAPAQTIESSPTSQQAKQAPLHMGSPGNARISILSVRAICIPSAYSCLCDLFFQLLFCAHEFSDPNRYVFIELVPRLLGSRLLVYTFHRPVRLAPASVVIHADGLVELPCKGRRPSSQPGLGSLSGSNMFFHVLTIPIPDTVHTTAHAAIIWLLWLRRHQDTGDEGAAVLDRLEPLGALDGASQTGAKDDACFFLGCCGLGGDRGRRRRRGIYCCFSWLPCSLILAIWYGLARAVLTCRGCGGLFRGGGRLVRGGGRLLGLLGGDGLGFRDDGLVVGAQGHRLLATGVRALVGGRGRLVERGNRTARHGCDATEHRAHECWGHGGRTGRVRGASNGLACAWLGVGGLQGDVVISARDFEERSRIRGQVRENLLGSGVGHSGKRHASQRQAWTKRREQAEQAERAQAPSLGGTSPLSNVRVFPCSTSGCFSWGSPFRLRSASGRTGGGSVSAKTKKSILSVGN